MGNNLTQLESKIKEQQRPLSPSGPIPSQQFSYQQPPRSSSQVQTYKTPRPPQMASATLQKFEFKGGSVEDFNHTAQKLRSLVVAFKQELDNAQIGHEQLIGLSADKFKDQHARLEMYIEDFERNTNNFIDLDQDGNMVIRNKMDLNAPGQVFKNLNLQAFPPLLKKFLFTIINAQETHTKASYFNYVQKMQKLKSQQQSTHTQRGPKAAPTNPLSPGRGPPQLALQSNPISELSLSQTSVGDFFHHHQPPARGASAIGMSDGGKLQMPTVPAPRAHGQQLGRPIFTPQQNNFTSETFSDKKEYQPRLHPKADPHAGFRQPNSSTRPASDVHTQGIRIDNGSHIWTSNVQTAFQSSNQSPMASPNSFATSDKHMFYGGPISNMLSQPSQQNIRSHNISTTNMTHSQFTQISDHGSLRMLPLKQNSTQQNPDAKKLPLLDLGKIERASTVQEDSQRSEYPALKETGYREAGAISFLFSKEGISIEFDEDNTPPEDTEQPILESLKDVQMQISVSLDSDSEPQRTRLSLKRVEEEKEEESAPKKKESQDEASLVSQQNALKQVRQAHLGLRTNLAAPVTNLRRLPTKRPPSESKLSEHASSSRLPTPRSIMSQKSSSNSLAVPTSKSRQPPAINKPVTSSEESNTLSSSDGEDFNQKKMEKLLKEKQNRKNEEAKQEVSTGAAVSGAKSEAVLKKEPAKKETEPEEQEQELLEQQDQIDDKMGLSWPETKQSIIRKNNSTSQVVSTISSNNKKMKFHLQNTKEYFDKSKKSVYVEDADMTNDSHSQQQSKRRGSDDSPKRSLIQHNEQLMVKPTNFLKKMKTNNKIKDKASSEQDGKLIARAFTINQFAANKFSSSNLSSNIGQSSIQISNKQSSIEKIGKQDEEISGGEYLNHPAQSTVSKDHVPQASLGLLKKQSLAKSGISVDTPDFVLYDQHSLGMKSPAVFDESLKHSSHTNKKYERIQTKSSKGEDKKAGELEESPDQSEDFKHQSSSELQLVPNSSITEPRKRQSQQHAQIVLEEVQGGQKNQKGKKLLGLITKWFKTEIDNNQAEAKVKEQNSIIERMEAIKKQLNLKNLPTAKPIAPVEKKKDQSSMELLLSRKHIKFNPLKDHKEQQFDEEAARIFGQIKEKMQAIFRKKLIKKEKIDGFQDFMDQKKDGNKEKLQLNEGENKILYSAANVQALKFRRSVNLARSSKKFINQEGKSLFKQSTVKSKKPFGASGASGSGKSLLKTGKKKNSSDSLSERADNDGLSLDKMDEQKKEASQSSPSSEVEEEDKQQQVIIMEESSSFATDSSSSSAHSYFRRGKVDKEIPIISVSRLDDMQPLRPSKNNAEVKSYCGTPRGKQPEQKSQASEFDQVALGQQLHQDQMNKNMKMFTKKITGYFKKEIWEEYDKKSQVSKHSSSNDSLRSQISMVSCRSINKQMEAKNDLFTKIGASVQQQPGGMKPMFALNAKKQNEIQRHLTHNKLHLKRMSSMASNHLMFKTRRTFINKNQKMSTDSLLAHGPPRPRIKKVNSGGSDSSKGGKGMKEKIPREGTQGKDKIQRHRTSHQGRMGRALEEGRRLKKGKTKVVSASPVSRELSDPQFKLPKSSNSRTPDMETKSNAKGEILFKHAIRQLSSIIDRIMSPVEEIEMVRRKGSRSTGDGKEQDIHPGSPSNLSGKSPKIKRSEQNELENGQQPQEVYLKPNTALGFPHKPKMDLLSINTIKEEEYDHSSMCHSAYPSENQRMAEGNKGAVIKRQMTSSFRQKLSTREVTKKGSFNRLQTPLSRGVSQEEELRDINFLDESSDYNRQKTLGSNIEAILKKKPGEKVHHQSMMMNQKSLGLDSTSEMHLSKSSNNLEPHRNKAKSTANGGNSSRGRKDPDQDSIKGDLLDIQQSDRHNRKHNSENKLGTVGKSSSHNLSDMSFEQNQPSTRSAQKGEKKEKIIFNQSPPRDLNSRIKLRDTNFNSDKDIHNEESNPLFRMKTNKMNQTKANLYQPRAHIDDIAQDDRDQEQIRSEKPLNLFARLSKSQEPDPPSRNQYSPSKQKFIFSHDFKDRTGKQSRSISQSKNLISTLRRIQSKLGLETKQNLPRLFEDVIYHNSVAQKDRVIKSQSPNSHGSNQTQFFLDRFPSNLDKLPQFLYSKYVTRRGSTHRKRAKVTRVVTQRIDSHGAFKPFTGGQRGLKKLMTSNNPGQRKLTKIHSQIQPEPKYLKTNQNIPSDSSMNSRKLKKQNSPQIPRKKPMYKKSHQDVLQMSGMMVKRKQSEENMRPETKLTTGALPKRSFFTFNQMELMKGPKSKSVKNLYDVKQKVSKKIVPTLETESMIHLQSNEALARRASKENTQKKSYSSKSIEQQKISATLNQIFKNEIFTPSYHNDSQSESFYREGEEEWEEEEEEEFTDYYEECEMDDDFANNLSHYQFLEMKSRQHTQYSMQDGDDGQVQKYAMLMNSEDCNSNNINQKSHGSAELQFEKSITPRKNQRSKPNEGEFSGSSNMTGRDSNFKAIREKIQEEQTKQGTKRQLKMDLAHQSGKKKSDSTTSLKTPINSGSVNKTSHSLTSSYNILNTMTEDNFAKQAKKNPFQIKKKEDTKRSPIPNSEYEEETSNQGPRSGTILLSSNLETPFSQSHDFNLRKKNHNYSGSQDNFSKGVTAYKQTEDFKNDSGESGSKNAIMSNMSKSNTASITGENVSPIKPRKTLHSQDQKNAIISLANERMAREQKNRLQNKSEKQLIDHPAAQEMSKPMLRAIHSNDPQSQKRQLEEMSSQNLLEISESNAFSNDTKPAGSPKLTPKPSTDAPPTAEPQKEPKKELKKEPLKEPAKKDPLKKELPQEAKSPDAPRSMETKKSNDFHKKLTTKETLPVKRAHAKKKAEDYLKRGRSEIPQLTSKKPMEMWQNIPHMIPSSNFLDPLQLGSQAKKKSSRHKEHDSSEFGNKSVSSQSDTTSNLSALRSCYTIQTNSVYSNKKGGKKQINQYLVVSKLGQGKFAKVKKVVNMETKDKYAMKIIDKQKMKKKMLAPKKSQFSLVEKEVAIMKKMGHPYVVKLIEIIDDPNHHKQYLIQELIEKGDLQNLLRNEKEELTESTARKYFRQLISAVWYCHEIVKILHRDIKPENILIDALGNIKLSDFGVSYYFAGPTSDPTMSGNAGSECYYCPESLSGKSYNGKDADMWACAVTLFEMTFGHLPFTGERFELMKSIQNKELEFSSAKIKLTKVEMESELFDLLTQMFHKDPAKRITVAAMQEHPWITQNGKDRVNWEKDVEYVTFDDWVPTEKEIKSAVTSVGKIKNVKILKKK